MAHEHAPNRPTTPPDPTSTHERAQPHAESGMGRLDNIPAPDQPDHSMHDEEPDGWDLAPNDIRDKRQKRHPRTEGKGGTP